ncbi:penicillin acylase family protein [Chitinimonas lacunae]|uniref:Penicillin acylase family protein n=1 Tax=Chitinimonas lacunae TaxID=1963018 RepID=A0ABV8MMS0_9NEIS
MTPTTPTRRPWRLLRLAALGCVATTALLATAGWGALRASLPQLDGEREVAGLSAPVDIERDALGVPTIRAAARGDIAYALGFLHAQDRFFQMDLMRRSAAGEVAALVGAAALPMDRANRLHRFRQRAETAVAALPAADRQLLQRYSDGVNAGLGSLDARPFEYLLLRQQPQSWQPADSLLVVYAMYFDLQGSQVRREFARGWLAERVNAAQLAFLLPEQSNWDALLDRDAPPLREPALPRSAPSWWRGQLTSAMAPARPDASASGSNNWALAGNRSVRGAALVADDMHLGLRLPNTWYRAAWQYPDRNGPRRVVGVTLPGTPVMVVGSNGRVAWGFSNSYGDWLDLVATEVDHDHSRYRSADGWLPLQTIDETIEVSHDRPARLTVQETHWGPLWRVGGVDYAVRWVAHDARNAVNLNLLRMEAADDVAGALAVGQVCGIPAQNLIVGDSSGHIGWTIAGLLPKRPWPGERNSFPLNGTDPHAAWTTYYAPVDYPQRVDPTAGQLWSANNRQLGGLDYLKIGDGGADLGARATQIRDRLSKLGQADEEDMLAIQLDDRALLIDVWRQRLLKLLDTQALSESPRRREARALLEHWSGRAAADAVGYRIARVFRDRVYHGLFGSLDRELRRSLPDVEYRDANSRWEVVANRLLDAAPDAWLPVGHADWRAFQLAQLDAALNDLTPDNRPLAKASWGERNRANIAHPLARFLPWFGDFLRAPTDPLPGDGNMPRVQGPGFGASERMVVAPGHEERGIFHMPGGQSGHPLSPYFLAGHDAWVRGQPTPFLPGPTVHSLRFTPTVPNPGS